MTAHISAAGVTYQDAGQGRPVVLLHAFPLSSAMWKPQLEALADEFWVIAPDLRGFGSTPGFTGAPSVDQMADDVAVLLDEVEVREPVALGGLSMGGYVALAFARRHAARLRALILADTKADADDGAAKANRDKLIDFAAHHTSRDVIEQLLPKLLAPETPARRPEVVEAVREIAGLQAPAGVIGALRALRDRPDATPGLAKIAVPTLVLVGRDDALTPPAQSEALAAAIPGAKLTVLDGAGHLSNLERPAAFTDAVRAFLRGLPA
jgi:pimeloyl-ACP methyl ester carboxylesterase